jgi:hypothetical protein
LCKRRRVVGARHDAGLLSAEATQS